jgi:hypothetical protein
MPRSTVTAGSGTCDTGTFTDWSSIIRESPGARSKVARVFMENGPAPMISDRIPVELQLKG